MLFLYSLPTLRFFNFLAGVARRVGDRLMFTMPKVRGHLGLQGSFRHGFGELLEQAMLANRGFGYLAASQQLFDQIRR